MAIFNGVDLLDLATKQLLIGSTIQFDDGNFLINNYKIDFKVAMITLELDGVIKNRPLSLNAKFIVDIPTGYIEIETTGKVKKHKK